MDILDSQRTDELATLLALAEQGSFAAAGRSLGRHPSVLSKRMQALERRLGVRLVEKHMVCENDPQRHVPELTAKALLELVPGSSVSL